LNDFFVAFIWYRHSQNNFLASDCTKNQVLQDQKSLVHKENAICFTEVWLK